MKKLFVLLSSFLFLWSCEQDDFIVDMSTTETGEESIAQTRAATSIADFSLVEELEDAGIYVRISNVANSSVKYLTKGKNDRLSLATNKNSEQQSWYFKGSKIVYGGSDWHGIYGYLPFIYRASDKNNTPILNGSLPGMMALGATISNPNSQGKYNIALFEQGFHPSGTLPYIFLRPTKVNSSSLTFNNEISELSWWNLETIGEYQLVNLEYVRTTVDDFELYSATQVSLDVENFSDLTQTFNENLGYDWSQGSTFSETEGITTTITSGLNIGLPNLVGKGSSIGYNETISSQTVKNHTFGEDVTKTIHAGLTANITVPPHSVYRVICTSYIYGGYLTYVATLKNIINGKTFRVKGKWKGNSFLHNKVSVYDITGGKNNLVNEFVRE